MNIGKNIKRLRTERGWSQQTLAEKSGLRAGTWIGRIENNKKIPRIGTLKKLAKALGCAVADIVK